MSMTESYLGNRRTETRRSRKITALAGMIAGFALADTIFFLLPHYLDSQPQHIDCTIKQDSIYGGVAEFGFDVPADSKSLVQKIDVKYSDGDSISVIPGATDTHIFSDHDIQDGLAFVNATVVPNKDTGYKPTPCGKYVVNSLAG